MVTIKVGLDKKEFMVHKGLLCHYSLYFEVTLKYELQSAEDTVVELPDHDMEAFAALNGWLCTRHLFDPRADEGKVPINHKILWQVYLFGDTLCMPALKNAAVGAIGARVINDWKAFCSSLRHFYEHAPRGSPLRKLAKHIALERYCEFALGSEFLGDLEDEVRKDNVVRRTVSLEEQYDTNRCEYHDHGIVQGSTSER